MIGYDIYKNALALLSIEDGGNDYKGAVPDTALCAVNEILGDLSLNIRIRSIFDEISVKEDALSALTNGVAMIISATRNMYNQNAFFTTVYNQKRAAVKNKSERVKNSIPFVSGDAV